MYPVVLFLHSLLRWLVLIAGLACVARAFAGWLGAKGWRPLDDRLGLLFTAGMDVQLLIGIVLYLFLSPLTAAALRDFGGAMSNAGLRYFAVEHVALMLLALILAHLGRARSRRAREDAARHRAAAIFYLLAVLAILAAIPWPFLTVGSGRPWFRL